MNTYTTPLVPRQVRLELTNRCNAKCAPCHRLTMTRPVGDMSMDLVEKCLRDAQQFPEPPREIVLSNYGESFLHPQWERAMEMAARLLPRTELIVPTNGALMTDRTVERLARAPTLRLVNFSVNAFLKESYEAFHKLPYEESYTTITRAITRLRQLRPDVTVWISMVRSSEFQSPKEVEMFQEHWSKYGVVQINEAEYSDLPPLVPVTLPCRSLFSDLVVLWDGQCLSCCYVADPVPEMVVGDAAKDSLLDIWHGKRFNEIRNLHKSGKRQNLATCASCTFA